LVRAYGSSAKAVIAHAMLQPFVFKETFTCKTAYPLVPRFEHFTSHQGVSIKGRDFENESVVWEMELSEAEKEDFLRFAYTFEREGFTVL